MKTSTIIQGILAIFLAVFFLTSCSKQSHDATQKPQYPYELVFQVSTDEPVNSYVLQSTIDQKVWADAATLLSVDDQGYGKFPIGVCVSDHIFYRVVPVYPYGRGIPSSIIMFSKNQ